MPNNGTMIDSHHHFWKYNTDDYAWISDDMTTLRRDCLVAELENDLDLCGVDQVISVQARCSEQENQFLLEQAKNSDNLVAGIVAWAPLTSENMRLFLDQYINEPLVKGIREIIQGTPEEQFLNNPDFDHGIRELTHRDLTFDLLVFHDQLPAAIAFADRHPNQRIVLNHCGKPPIRSGDSPKLWARNIRELARRPHVYCKFSGLMTEIQDRGNELGTDLIRPYFDTVLKAFGPERLMFGSDWPVSLLGTTYPVWLNIVDDLIHPLSEDEKSAIRTDTATDFYQI
jgi:L-fuconolactonase